MCQTLRIVSRRAWTILTLDLSDVHYTAYVLRSICPGFIFIQLYHARGVSCNESNWTRRLYLVSESHSLPFSYIRHLGSTYGYGSRPRWETYIVRVWKPVVITWWELQRIVRRWLLIITLSMNNSPVLAVIEHILTCHSRIVELGPTLDAYPQAWNLYISGSLPVLTLVISNRNAKTYYQSLDTWSKQLKKILECSKQLLSV